ncbi:D-tyrosyl-tRNA(Tyr) deacylase [uncultured Clostridium sp.]|uniref:D-aminoacyl-tRNA deacylase n=1 Tax=uncultured Clostridium sp. TaxID=59620 RepID=UPI000822D8C8|nr:D-aminoacyl-tRNA deacylase [uncultured Clostridium sp.]SCJ99315.1 D-tyrosyl-tRNA(Tyr) deacylase [uncultured Clostridium sp.]
MRAVVQRVKKSSVKVDGEIVGAIQSGLNVLIGICEDDTLEDLKYIVDKVTNLRIFHDDNDKMNLSVKDIDGEILAISQFTLYGDCRKGRRPNFMNALGGEEAEKLYDKFVEMLRETGIEIATGVFGAHMDVEIQNDGPVTILLDSKKTF